MDGDWEEVCFNHFSSTCPSHEINGGAALLAIANHLQLSRITLPPAVVGHAPTPVTTMAFDTAQELLWAANSFGRVMSFYSTDMQRYTSFIAGQGPVHQLLVHDKGVIVLCEKCIHMASRRGIPIWHISCVEVQKVWRLC